MREWIPGLSPKNEETSSDTEAEAEEDDPQREQKDETPTVSDLLDRENVSQTKSELTEVWEEDREQAYFFIYAICVGLGFVSLLYYYGGEIPWYAVGAYVLVVLTGLGILFDDAFDEAPHRDSENTIVKFLKRGLDDD